MEKVLKTLTFTQYKQSTIPTNHNDNIFTFHSIATGVHYSVYIMSDTFYCLRLLRFFDGFFGCDID